MSPSYLSLSHRVGPWSIKSWVLSDFSHISIKVTTCSTIHVIVASKYDGALLLNLFWFVFFKCVFFFYKGSLI